MRQVTENYEFAETGMFAWNALTALLEPDEIVVFDDVEEFKDFYNSIIDRIFEEEVSA